MYCIDIPGALTLGSTYNCNFQSRHFAFPWSSVGHSQHTIKALRCPDLVRTMGDVFYNFQIRLLRYTSRCLKSERKAGADTVHYIPKKITCLCGVTVVGPVRCCWVIAIACNRHRRRIPRVCTVPIRSILRHWSRCWYCGWRCLWSDTSSGNWGFRCGSRLGDCSRLWCHWQCLRSGHRRGSRFRGSRGGCRRCRSRNGRHCRLLCLHRCSLLFHAGRLQLLFYYGPRRSRFLICHVAKMKSSSIIIIAMRMPPHLSLAWSIDCTLDTFIPWRVLIGLQELREV